LNGQESSKIVEVLMGQFQDLKMRECANMPMC
jgi:hypothetical protein